MIRCGVTIDRSDLLELTVVLLSSPDRGQLRLTMNLYVQKSLMTIQYAEKIFNTRYGTGVLNLNFF